MSDLDNEATSQERSSPVVEIFSFCVCPFQTQIYAHQDASLSCWCCEYVI